MVIRVRNLNESSYLCQQYIVSRKASKKDKNIVSHGTYTPHHISSSGRSVENKITYVHMYYLEFHAKSTCLTIHLLFNHWHGETFT